MSRVIDICIIEVSLEYSAERLTDFLNETIAQIGDSFPGGELSIAFMNDAKLAEIHDDFMGDSSETDVITFPSVDCDLAGEICVSVDRAISQSKEHHTNFSDELSLYLIHGCLHLAGYDDLQDEDIHLMRQAESRLMEHHRQSFTLPKFVLTS